MQMVSTDHVYFALSSIKLVGVGGYMGVMVLYSRASYRFGPVFQGTFSGYCVGAVKGQPNGPSLQQTPNKF